MALLQSPEVKKNKCDFKYFIFNLASKYASLISSINFSLFSPSRLVVRLNISRKGNSLTCLSSRLCVQANVVVKLGLFLVDFILVICSLSLLNLKSGHLQEQLQNLVLNFAILKCRCRRAASGVNLLVESVCLSVLRSLPSCVDDSQI
jgi:hypothetical protein